MAAGSLISGTYTQFSPLHNYSSKCLKSEPEAILRSMELNFGVFQLMNIQETRYSYREIIRIAWPVLAGLLMQQMIGLTDTAFLGRLSETAMGAASLGSIYYLALFMIGFGFSNGGQILIGRCNGSGTKGEIGRIFYCSLLFLMLMAVVLIGISTWAAPWFLKPLIKSPAVLNETLEYLKYRNWGLLFSFIAAIFRAFYVGITRTRILTVSALAMLVVNMVLNYALIFGKWGFAPYGIAGAAIASIIAEFVAMLCFIVAFSFSVNKKRYGFNHFTFLNFSLLKRVWNVSIWSTLQPFCAVGVWFFFFVAVEHLGERTLASINLIRGVSMLPWVLINGLATTGSTLISNLMGAEKQGQVIPLIKRITGLSFLLNLPLFIAAALLPYWTLRIFTDSPELIQSSISGLYVVILSQVIQIPAYVWFCAVSGTGNTRAALIIEALTLVGYSVSVWYFVMYLQGSAAVCWLTEIVYQIFALSFSLLFFRFSQWRLHKI